MRDAALVCHQLGLTLDPDNWFMERSQIPSAGTNEDIVLSNVQCTDDDVDVTRCRAEAMDDFENSCTHEHDVGVRCTEAAWAGLRLGPLALRSDLQYITIDRAGLLDYTTSSFKPGELFVYHYVYNQMTSFFETDNGSNKVQISSSKLILHFFLYSSADRLCPPLSRRREGNKQPAGRPWSPLL